jgi:2-dehydro-3-deoxyphosphogalactonate aldolase
MLPDALLHELPLVAILRGIAPDRVIEIGQILHDAGIRAIEVPLNSPDPFDSVARLAAYFGDACVCGAGTVLKRSDVDRVSAAGGKMVVSPNTDASVIGRTIERQMIAIPGFATASEAFAAIAAGASVLKLFPANTYGPGHLKALRSVLPVAVRVFAVGGIGADQVAQWVQAGAAGFGFGSELYRPDYASHEISERARKLVEAVQRAAPK